MIFGGLFFFFFGGGGGRGVFFGGSSLGLPWPFLVLFLGGPGLSCGSWLFIFCGFGSLVFFVHVLCFLSGFVCLVCILCFDCFVGCCLIRSTFFYGTRCLSCSFRGCM